MVSTCYVCLECRTVKRGRIVAGLQGPHRCPQCRGVMLKLNPGIRIPRKDDARGWREIVRETKRAENRWVKYRENIRKWESEQARRKEQNLTIQEHAATSDQELRYIGWQRRRLKSVS